MKIILKLIVFVFSGLVILAGVLRFGSETKWTPLTLIWTVY